MSRLTIQQQQGAPTTAASTTIDTPTKAADNLKGKVEQSIIDAEVALTEIDSILSDPSLSDDQKSSLESIKSAIENLEGSLSQYLGTLTRRREKRGLDQLGVL